MITRFSAKPLNPKKFHVLNRAISGFRSAVYHFGMENTKNAVVPVWVSFWTCFCRKDHNITVGMGIHRILIMTDVVCGVVNAKNLHRIYLVPNYSDCVMVFIRILSLITIKFLVSKAGQKMIFKPWNEVLRAGMSPKVLCGVELGTLLAGLFGGWCTKLKR